MSAAMSARKPIVIAHRGACGYLPEHTLEAKALAIGLGADYVEQDIVLTRDGVPIVTHDIFLEDVTDVAQRFPGRARSDRHFYAIDFTLAEIRTLSRHERVHGEDGAVFDRRFPADSAANFAIVTLQEEISFVQGLNHSLKRNVGLYTEVKYPAWHREQGQDITRIVLEMLGKHGYRSREDKAYFQCFDALELQRARRELGNELAFIQLIGENAWKESTTDYDAMRTEEGIAGVAAVADGIGPEITQVVEWDADAAPVVSPLAAIAHRHGLAVHPYTHRIDSLPRHAPDSPAVLDALFESARVDGLFTDFTDVVVSHLRARGRR